MAAKRIVACLMFAGMFSIMLSAGCDRPPSPPKNEEGDSIKVLSVAIDDAAEQEAATALETARVNYRYRLYVLHAYYEKVGNMDKRNWARRELKNIDNIQTFQWAGLPIVEQPPGESLAQVGERALVEYVVAARVEYTQVLAALEALYENQGLSRKASMVRNMQDRFDPVRTYLYFLSAEIPPADLKPTDVVTDADALFDEAVRLHKNGKGLLQIALTTSYHKQRQALEKFLELVRNYPSSNKIALSAYYIGYIYKEYFNENIRAVNWYERAWQWDPHLTKSARFQAATVHDLRLHNYAKAVECYRQVIRHEQFNTSNVSFAHRRIRKLTGQ